MSDIKVFKELQKEIHQIAKSKGWYEKEPSVGNFIALCHSDVRVGWKVYVLSFLYLITMYRLNYRPK